MRLLLDQMIDCSVACVLRERGHDVACTAEVGMAHADDLEILEYCIKHDRILITLDEHFGDWTVVRLKEHPGVMRLKVSPASTEGIKRTLLPFLDRYSGRDFRDTLVIVKSTVIRWVRTAQQ